MHFYMSSPTAAISHFISLLWMSSVLGWWSLGWWFIRSQALLQPNRIKASAQERLHQKGRLTRVV